ncbi:MAG: hypothetical protein IT370_09255 [Deltaproteobacteria bacterium]|nr:hypothetical protein [Deltaproteobacteria bacterium]
MRIAKLVTPAVLATSFLLALALGGCSSDDVETHPVDTAAADAKPAHRYVLSAIDVPDQSTEIDGFAMNLDHDDHGSPDNKVGSLIQISELYLGRSLQRHVDDELAAGRMNTLVELHSDGFDDQLDVALELRPGVREDVGLRAAALDGPLMRIYGRIQGGRFYSQLPGQVWIELAMFSGQPALAVELIGARVEGRVGPEGLTDLRLAGGITFARFQRDFAPALHRLVLDRLATGPDDDDALALRQVFDTNKDGAITLQEFLASNTIQTIFSPDVDLARDAALPRFVATPDGTKESLSLGVQISATPLGFGF